MLKNVGTLRARLASTTALGAGIVAASLAMQGGPARASSFAVGEVQVDTQVTISTGFGIRTQNRDPRLICPQNYPGGSATTCNGDDGNLNFDKGDFVYAPVRVQGEATATWQNFTAYVRAQAFYDYVYDHGDFDQQGGNPAYVANYRDLSGRQTDAAQNAAAYDYALQDLWVRGSFDIGERQLTVKLGQQTINWGEAAVTPLSLAQVNSFDQSKLRVPGAEIRDAIRSMPAIFTTFEAGGGLSVEAFYQFQFRRSKTDAAGSFFSTTDIGGQGGTGFGANGDYDQYAPDATNFAIGNVNLSVPQADYKINSDGKNWGVAARYFSPELNNTEFGFYFANIQPRSPVPVFYTADSAHYVGNAAVVATVTTAVTNYVTANPFNPGTETPAQFGARVAAFQSQATSLATAQAVQQNARNSQIVLENPGDVQMIGSSFNTTLDALGVSLAGELALHHNLPVLIDGETWATAFACGLIPTAISVPCSLAGPSYKNQLSDYLGIGTLRPGTRLAGYTLEDVYTYVLRGIKQLGASDFPVSVIGADSMSLLMEFGGVYVNLPDKSVLAFDAPGTGKADDGSATDPLHSKYEPATDWSGGLTLVVSAAYPDAIAGINLTPSVRFQTGLFGNTPLTGGYTEHASAITFQIDAEYLLAWKASIGYTDYFGAGRQNLLNDRDFFQMTLSYSF
ncbi:DUF1302 domain-containing protein [Zavarzinia sp.]|uniref:DUF1302 domain-containing protein n=1 Tax=Zavarzinia sp. TaxID=2027920 RepID=UPI003565F525